jgi:hypothetical protein
MITDGKYEWPFLRVSANFGVCRWQPLKTEIHLSTTRNPRFRFAAFFLAFSFQRFRMTMGLGRTDVIVRVCSLDEQ